MNKDNYHDSARLHFPSVHFADENGLLTIGGDFSPERVFYAHQRGIFPWYIENETPVMWWSPEPRGVIYCAKVHISRSLRRFIKNCNYLVSFDNDFAGVVNACRHAHGKSWIGDKVFEVYGKLHLQGRAHSVEVWRDEKLIGGLYGVCLDNVFCAESMFHCEKNASKIALIAICKLLSTKAVSVLDTQFLTPHLQSMGGCEIARRNYQKYLSNNPDRLRGSWFCCAFALGSC